jgi:hypothetical protein
LLSRIATGALRSSETYDGRFQAKKRRALPTRHATLERMQIDLIELSQRLPRLEIARRRIADPGASDRVHVNMRKRSRGALGGRGVRCLRGVASF